MVLLHSGAWLGVEQVRDIDIDLTHNETKPLQVFLWEHVNGMINSLA